MTVKKYDTVPPSNTSGGPSSEAIIWHVGSLLNKTTDVYIHYGREQNWSRDVNWNVRNNQVGLENPNAFRMGGNNGLDHEANYEQNISGFGRWIPMEFVNGFSIDFQQDSTAGHAMYLKNAGIECVDDSGTTYRWGSNNRSRQNDYDRHTATYRFTSAERQAMAANGGRFHRFICRLSTRGGTGTRETYVTLGSFRLLYDSTGSDYGRWVLPSSRSFGNRNNPDIIVG